MTIRVLQEKMRNLIGVATLLLLASSIVHARDAEIIQGNRIRSFRVAKNGKEIGVSEAFSLTLPPTIPGFQLSRIDFGKDDEGLGRIHAQYDSKKSSKITYLSWQISPDILSILRVSADGYPDAVLTADRRAHLLGQEAVSILTAASPGSIFDTVTPLASERVIVAIARIGESSQLLTIESRTGEIVARKDIKGRYQDHILHWLTNSKVAAIFNGRKAQRVQIIDVPSGTVVYEKLGSHEAYFVENGDILERTPEILSAGKIKSRYKRLPKF